MSIKDLLAFKKEREKEEKRKMRLYRNKFLGSTCHMALFVTGHLCSKCSTEISGGMSYIRKVYATSTGIRVRKTHWPVCPDHDWKIYEAEREQADAERSARKAA